MRRPPPLRQVAMRRTALYHGARDFSRVAAPPSSLPVSTEKKIPVVHVDSYRTPCPASWCAGCPGCEVIANITLSGADQQPSDSLQEAPGRVGRWTGR